MPNRNDVIMSSAKLIRESAAALLLAGTEGKPDQWWPKSYTRVLSRSFTPAAGKHITFEAPRWLFDAKWGGADSRHVIDGYNVEFQGARPARAGEDY